jgi:RimJ/RimL family protein N-acetyltransferase
MKVRPITSDGTVEVPYVLPEIVTPILDTFAKMYRFVGYRPPWIGYLVSESDHLVGTCAFKSPPAEGRVEIAYFTFPEHEGNGVATRMVECLLSIAGGEDPSITIAAQTLPQYSASTKILQKHGFVFWDSLQHPEDGLVWEWRRTLT